VKISLTSVLVQDQEQATRAPPRSLLYRGDHFVALKGDGFSGHA